MSEYESSSDGDYMDDALTAGSEVTRTSHKVITAESLALAQQQDLQTVVDLLEVKVEHARIMLIHFRWDVHGLFNTFAEDGKDKLFVKVGLGALQWPTRTNKPECKSAKYTCGVCFEDVPRENASQMDCEHVFCSDCWQQYLTMKVKEGESKRLVCMAPRCGTICDENKVRELLDEDTVLQFDRSLLESYIEDNAKVKWCPSVPHCGNAIKIQGEPFYEIECVCSEQFCFNCGRQPHSPCSCEMWKNWERRILKDESSQHWIASHTQNCPNCHKAVHKTVGCNHISCTCGHHFCYSCGQTLNDKHSECGRFTEIYNKGAAKSRQFLKRYEHYFSRWTVHLNSLKLEAAQKITMEEKISKLEDSDLVIKDYSWLTGGFQMLSRARRALSYSYVFAFFMFGEMFEDDFTPEQNLINQRLFEDQQQKFEEEVEKLSKLIELPLKDLQDDVSSARFQIISGSDLVGRLCLRLHDLIENDLLDSVITSIHHIAPYTGSLVERARQESPGCST